MTDRHTSYCCYMHFSLYPIVWSECMYGWKACRPVRCIAYEWVCHRQRRPLSNYALAINLVLWALKKNYINCKKSILKECRINSSPQVIFFLVQQLQQIGSQLWFFHWHHFAAGVTFITKGGFLVLHVGGSVNPQSAESASLANLAMSVLFLIISSKLGNLLHLQPMVQWFSGASVSWLWRQFLHFAIGGPHVLQLHCEFYCLFSKEFLRERGSERRQEKMLNEFLLKDNLWRQQISPLKESSEKICICLHINQTTTDGQNRWKFLKLSGNFLILSGVFPFHKNMKPTGAHHENIWNTFWRIKCPSFRGTSVCCSSTLTTLKIT